MSPAGYRIDIDLGGFKIKRCFSGFIDRSPSIGLSRWRRCDEHV